MIFSKKDRIALVISALLLIIGLTFLFAGGSDLFLLAVLPVLVYWGYRFIKNDISFIKVKEPE